MGSYVKDNYLRVETIRKIIDNFNCSSSEKVSFCKIYDRSYFQPRWKERHNILCYKNFKIIATNELKTIWRIEDEKHNILLKSSLTNCLAWIKEEYNEV